MYLVASIRISYLPSRCLCAPSVCLIGGIQGLTLTLTLGLSLSVSHPLVNLTSIATKT